MEKRIVEKIRQHRKAVGMSQKEIARRLEIPCRNYARIERGESRLKFSVLLTLIEKLELTRVDFFENL